MKKILMIFLLMFIMSVVNAKNDIMIKESEVAKNPIEESWNNTNRRLLTLGDNYITYDSYYITPNPVISDRFNGLKKITLNSYDKDWNNINSTEFILSYFSKFLSNENILLLYNYKRGVDTGFDYELTKYDENLNTYNIKINYTKICDEDSSYDRYCFLNFVDIYSGTDGIYLLAHERKGINDSTISEIKVLKINEDFENYSISDINNQEIKDMFPKYYYKYIVDNNEGNNNYYVVDDKVLISGKSLRYYENGVEKFDITNDDYVKFGNAKVYNNLIMVIGYTNYIEPIYNGEDTSNNTSKYGLNNSDILFYDLDGNLIGTYEHNYYDYDIRLINDKIIISNLYIDGICNVVVDGYYAYNSNCNATLMNEIYSLDEEYLSKTKNEISSDKEETKNPETLPDVNDVVLLCFIALITTVAIRIVKIYFKKYKTS